MQGMQLAPPLLCYIYTYIVIHTYIVYAAAGDAAGPAAAMFTFIVYWNSYAVARISNSNMHINKNNISS